VATQGQVPSYVNRGGKIIDPILVFKIRRKESSDDKIVFMWSVISLLIASLCPCNQSDIKLFESVLHLHRP
jgi:hypothetical protein